MTDEELVRLKERVSVLEQRLAALEFHLLPEKVDELAEMHEAHKAQRERLKERRTQ